MFFYLKILFLVKIYRKKLSDYTRDYLEETMNINYLPDLTILKFYQK
jgi:hypothetical protein